MANDQSRAVTLTGGALNAAISDAVVKLHSQYVGRGANKVQTFHHDNIVVTVMEDTLTTAERSLVSSGKRDTVLAMRHEFQRTMDDDLVSAVERLTARKVTAFMSANHLEPELAGEIFVLDERIA